MKLTLFDVYEQGDESVKAAVRIVHETLIAGVAKSNKELRGERDAFRRTMRNCPMGEHCLHCQQLRQRVLAIDLLLDEATEQEGLQWLIAERR